MAAFSRDPVKETLLEVEPGAAKLGLEVFKSVMRYMDDLPKARTSDLEVVQFICASVIANPALRDETFAAVLKQLYKNPKLESLAKGWALLAILCGSFLPARRSSPTSSASACRTPRTRASTPSCPTWPRTAWSCSPA